MPYFPFFVNIESKRFLVVGGGTVALRKIEKLMPFKPDIVVVSPEICEEITALSVKTTLRSFEDNDIKNAFAVIAATDDEAVNSHIFELCTRHNIPVNTVDDKEKCSFYFPALAVKDNITVGISTAGTTPVFARFLRESIEAMLDDRYIETAAVLGRFRSKIKVMFPAEEQRREAAEAVLDLCMASPNELPNDEEITQMLERIREFHENKNRHPGQ